MWVLVLVVAFDVKLVYKFINLFKIKEHRERERERESSGFKYLIWFVWTQLVQQVLQIKEFINKQKNKKKY